MSFRADGYGPSNGESTLASPPLHSPEQAKPTIWTTTSVPMSTFVPLSTGASSAIPPPVYDLENHPRHPTAPPDTQPPIVSQPVACYPINVVEAGAAPGLVQYPVQVPYVDGSTSGNNVQPNDQPLRVSLQSVQVNPQLSAKIPDEMCLSIMSTIFCVFFLGIPAIILSHQANKLKFVDPLRALSKAQTARILNGASFIVGTMTIIVVAGLHYRT